MSPDPQKRRTPEALTEVGDERSEPHPAQDPIRGDGDAAPNPGGETGDQGDGTQGQQAAVEKQEPAKGGADRIVVSCHGCSLAGHLDQGRR